MRTFEFHFNPKIKPGLIFDSFCFEPANIYEKKVGSLYMAGLLKNALPQNVRFLDNLARIIRERYYKFTLKSAEKALKESLKSANEHLDNLAKKGDISWLGNLSFAAISLKDFEMNFTKVSDIKILLLRRGQIIDIDKRLKFQDLEPYPLKVFPNIVSGKLAENDIILILTKDIFNSFQNHNLLSKIAEMSSAGSFEGAKIKEILQKKTEELSKIFGTCLLIYLNKEDKKETLSSRQIISPKINPAERKKASKEFSFKSIFIPLLASFKKIPRLNWPGKKWNRNPILVLAMIVFLSFGFLISKREEKQKLNSYKTIFSQTREKTEKAKNILTLKGNNPAIKKQAADILNGAWEEISSLVKIGSGAPKDFRNQIFSLKDEIASNLFELNKMVILDDPELILEVETEQIIPQEIISDDKNIYLFSPYSQNILRIFPDGKSEIVPNDKKFNLAARSGKTLSFFAKPNKISILEEGVFSETSLLAPSWNYNFEKISSFNSNLYFWDGKTGEILKYPYLGNLSWGTAEKWLLPQTKKIIGINSMAVDGNIWIINGNNSISRYYAGQFQEILSFDIFPSPKYFTKILVLPDRGTNSPLYLLEPNQKRIIILDKNGEIIRQFQSEKFDNLLDFSVQADGKTIYLLNGQKVYKIKTSE